MKDLEASPFLTNVQLDKSELALEQGKEVTQFQLTIGYTPARYDGCCVACRSTFR